MATSFTSLPVVNLSLLKATNVSAASPSGEVLSLAEQLDQVFSTSGFAYLTNVPLSFTHDEVFELSKQFFSLPERDKMRLAKRTFVKRNENTYRGYFPTQPGKALDNLKEGFEIGSGKVKTAHASSHHGGPFSLYEPNVWPSSSNYFPAASRRRVTQLYGELQALSAQLLSLLALSLNKPANNFTHWLDDSLSTLRLLHYPPVESPRTIVKDDDASSITSGSERSTTSTSEDSSSLNVEADDKQIPTIAAMDDEATTGAKLSCTPHTDSGILTLLHQDPTGGLEVLNSSDQWIAAPYIPNTIVVNIGDLMAKVSGGRWVATMHRVRAPRKKVAEEGEHGAGFGRFSVPFFFEPGEECLVRDLDGEGAVRYGDHVRAKMKTWVEFQGDNDDDDESG